MLGPLAQIAAFGVLSLIAVAGALGMATTMSMYRSGIFLMASFIGVSGLFILLSADLLGLLQVMMYIGGMLVMVLFMVLFSHDPGGDMMAGMELPLVERLFSRGLLPRDDPEAGASEVVDLDGADERDGDHEHAEHADTDHGETDHDGMDHGGMDHGDMDMSMVTPVRPLAAIAGIATAAGLVTLLLLRPAWHRVDELPDPDSARRIGDLLMSKYMMAFEGAGLLILVGIFGAVFIARPDRHPSPSGRDARVAQDAPPPELDDDRLEPDAPEASLGPLDGDEDGEDEDGGGGDEGSDGESRQGGHHRGGGAS